MPLVVKDRVKETTTTTGTGTLTLAGAVTGFQAFSVIGDGNTTYYTITDGTNFEVGVGTYTLSGTTLSRDTILESSNSGSAVNFSAGSKEVFVTYPAERAVYTDAAGTVITPATASTLGVVSGGTGASTLTGVVKGTGTAALTAGTVNLASEVTGTLPVANGGTGQTTYTNGQLLIGNTTGNTLTKATLTQGTGITVTNGAGTITIAASGGGGTVTSVSGTGTVDGVSLSGTVTTSGNLTLSGSVSIAGSQVTSGDIAADRITNALNAGGSAPIFASRAWVNFNGTGTVAIRASGNVSSITDVGAGLYTVNFTTAMSDSNYSLVGTAQSGGGLVSLGVDGASAAGAASLYSTTQAQIRCRVAAGTSTDSNTVNVSIFR